MTKRVEGLGEVVHPVYGPRFNVTPEWCLAINNIDYVRNSIPRFVSELGMAEIIQALSDFQSPAAADHCNQTLLSIIENAIDSVGNLILDLQETVAEKVRSQQIIVLIINRVYLVWIWRYRSRWTTLKHAINCYYSQSPCDTTAIVVRYTRK